MRGEEGGRDITGEEGGRRGESTVFVAQDEYEDGLEAEEVQEIP